MSFSLGRFLLQFQISSKASSNFSPSLIPNVATARNFAAMAAAATPVPIAHKAGEQLLVVIGGGAAGFYGAIRAKTVAPNLNVVIIEKGKPLSKVKISGGGRCNVTNGHFADPMVFAEFNYPRGHRELKGSFFNTHGHMDTMSWFSDHGVPLKIEDDGRVFPVSNCSSSIIDCLLTEAKRRGVSLHTGKTVTNASVDDDGKFYLKIEKRSVDFSESVEADYILIASGSSRQGYGLVTQLGHSILDPVPSLFTFKIKDSMLTELSGVSFSKVEAKLKLENVKRNVPHLTQVGPMVVTHWGLSGPVILRLSAWGARDLFASVYKGVLIVDFIPDLHIEEAKSILSLHKNNFAVIFDKHLLIKVLQKQKVVNSSPSEFGLAKRFWKYILDRQSINGDTLWASISNNSISSTAHTLKNCTFNVEGKGQFKDEFVTAGGVPLSEISLNTMESKICSLLFFAGEVLNVDGVTGGFNFQNAWSGGYIAGSSIGKLAAENAQQERVL